MEAVDSLAYRKRELFEYLGARCVSHAGLAVSARAVSDG
jgi:hypothetical protein